MRLWGNLAESIVQDMHYAVRGLRRNPGFALVIVVSLGLGIGANTALFSVLDAVLLRPLPVAHPEQLFALDLTKSRFRAPQRFSYPMFGRMQSVAGSSIAAMSRIARMHGRLDGVSDQESAARRLPPGPKGFPFGSGGRLRNEHAAALARRRPIGRVRAEWKRGVSGRA